MHALPKTQRKGRFTQKRSYGLIGVEGTAEQWGWHGPVATNFSLHHVPVWALWIAASEIPFLFALRVVHMVQPELDGALALHKTSCHCRALHTSIESPPLRS